MGFLTGLFGGETNVWTIFLALIIVITLIIIAVWFLKLIFKASVTIAGGRKRRLAMVDSIAIDAKRNLILVRRDDVEHLILVSGTGDVLIEGSIPSPEIARISNTKTNQVVPMPSIKTPISQTNNNQASNNNAPNNNFAPKKDNSILETKTPNDRNGLSRLLRKDPKIEPTPVAAPPIATPIQDATQTTTFENAQITPSVTSDPIAASIETIVTAAKDTIPQTSDNVVTPLQSTGILKPVSEIVPVQSGNMPNSTTTSETANETQNAAPGEIASPATGEQKKSEEVEPHSEDNTNTSPSDSAKNNAQQVDTKAMESIKEGAISGDDGAEPSKENSDPTTSEGSKTSN